MYVCMYVGNNEILKTERGNSSPSSNSKQKIEPQAEPSSKKKNIVLTGDTMVNRISEKGFSVNHKVKIVNFPGGTSETILETGCKNHGKAKRSHSSCWNYGCHQ